jgi:hypothetical protein
MRCNTNCLLQVPEACTASMVVAKKTTQLGHTPCQAQKHISCCVLADQVACFRHLPARMCWPFCPGLGTAMSAASLAGSVCECI